MRFPRRFLLDARAAYRPVPPFYALVQVCRRIGIALD
jgi:hypothetical protein